MKYIGYLLLIILLTPQAFAKPSVTLKIATYLEPPFVDFVDNEFIGEDVALVKALADAVNLETEFIQCPFSRCLHMVISGKADMIVSVRKTSTRMKSLIFLTPAILIQKYPINFYLDKYSEIKINSYKDLSDLVVGTVRGYSYYDEFDKDDSLNKVETTNSQQLVNMLAKNRIDTFLDREESVIPLITGSENANRFKVAAYKYEKSVRSFIAISKQSKLAVKTKELSNELAKLIAKRNRNFVLKERGQNFTK